MLTNNPLRSPKPWACLRTSIFMTLTTYMPGRRPALTHYTVRASVDWIDVKFQVAKPRQGRHLSNYLGASWVEPCRDEQEPGAAFTPSGFEFIARFQDPKSTAIIQNRLATVDAKNLTVEGIEIAVDFCPRGEPDRDELALLLTHLFIGHQFPESSPRVGLGKGFGGAIASPASMLNHFRDGKTCYMSLPGTGPARMQRAYIKQTDQGANLPESEVRARFEFVYRRPEPIENMLVGDWPKKIHRDFTFRRLDEPTTHVASAVNARSLQIGTRAPRSNRRVFDPRTTADTELNRRTHDALRGMRKRWFRAD